MKTKLNTNQSLQLDLKKLARDIITNIKEKIRQNWRILSIDIINYL